MRRPNGFRPWLCLTALVLGGASAPARGQDQAAAGPSPLLLKPRFTIAGGVISYQEHGNFETRFQEPLIQPGGGLDLIFSGYHGLSLDFDFLQSETGTERVKQGDSLVQENDLLIRRFSLSVLYTISTWDRSARPVELAMPSRLIRFSAGAGPIYRHQWFRRDDFFVFTSSPPAFVPGPVMEDFDIFGGEFLFDLEVGPRHIVAPFVRGRAGASFVTVANNGFHSLGIGTEESRINTSGVHGSIEAGLVSQPSPHIELRLGYRWFRQDVFEKKKSVSGVDPTFGPVQLTLTLPDNTTEMHVVFFEAAFPF